MSAVRRSSGAFGGLPILFFPMPVNIPIKSLLSTLAIATYYGYDKYRQKKTPSQPARIATGRTRTGFRQIPAW
jgi:hypothetical protein